MEKVKVTFWYIVLMVLTVLATFSLAYAANTKLSALTADATPATDSLVYTVDDPGGTPVSRKSTVGQLLAAANDLDSSGDVADDSHNHVYSNVDAFTEANLYSILSDVAEFLETNDAATLASLDTGEGANELFDMDQNVTTASSPSFAGMTIAAASTARAYYRDSDAPGSDKDGGWSQWSYVDGADGSENFDIILASTQGGAEDTEQLRFDESDDRWETTKIFSSGSLTPVSGDCDDFAANFTGENFYGGTFVCTAAGTCQLPVMVVGMNFTIVTAGATACVFDTNAADGYLMDGTTGVEGKNGTNLSTAGDIAVFQYYDADDWLITTNGWTPEA